GTGAIAGAVVRVYRTASTSGATGPQDVIAYAGQATADVSGNWTLTCPSAGCEVGLPGAGQVTANQTTTSGDSSEMADPKSYPDLTPATRSFTVDATAPETKIDSGPAAGAPTADRTPTFGFSANDAGATFRCRLDGAAFGPCNGPGRTHTSAALADGPHSFA